MKFGLFNGTQAVDSEHYGQYYFFGVPPNHPEIIPLDKRYQCVIPYTSKLSNAGETFTLQSTIPISTFKGAAYLISLDKIVVFGISSGNLHVLYSTNEGASWTAVSTSFSIGTDATFCAAIDGSDVYMMSYDSTLGSDQIKIHKFNGSTNAVTSMSSHDNTASTTPWFGKRNNVWYLFIPNQGLSSSSDLTSWTDSTDSDINSSFSCAITASGMISFVTSNSLIKSSITAGTIDGPWNTYYHPYTWNTSLVWSYDEIITISPENRVAWSSDYGATWKEHGETVYTKANIYNPTYNSSSHNQYVARMESVIGHGEKFIASSTFIQKLDDASLETPNKKYHSAYIRLTLDGNYTDASVLASNETSKFYFISYPTPKFYKLMINEGSSVQQYYVNVSQVDFARSEVPCLIVGKKVDPTKVVGCTLTYKPDNSYKACNGIDTYSGAAPELRRAYPKVTSTFIPGPLTGFSSDLPVQLYHAAYVNSTLIYYVACQGGSSSSAYMAYSTNGGASWNYGTTLASVSYFDQGYVSSIVHDGTFYYVSAGETTAGNKLYKASTLNGTFTALTWTNGKIIKLYALSGSNLIAVTESGVAYQSTNSGSSFSSIGTISGSPTVINVTKIGSTYYVMTTIGIFSTSSFTSFTLVSNTTNKYNWLTYNSTTNTWITVAIVSDPGAYNAIEASTDNMSSWTVVDDQIPFGSDRLSIFPTNTIMLADNSYYINESNRISVDGQRFFQYSINDQYLTHPTNGSSLKTFDYNGTTAYYPSAYSMQEMPFTLTIDPTAMRMPITGIFTMNYMKIHA